MNIEQYKQQFSDTDAVGWDCIDEALVKLYPDQEPKHYAPGLYYALGGDNPLDGISVYENKDHLHFVTYGFSELYYDEEAAGASLRLFSLNRDCSVYATLPKSSEADYRGRPFCCKKNMDEVKPFEKTSRIYSI